MFSVLERAHVAADQTPAEPLPGATTIAFAASFPGDDQTFVAEMTDGDVCLENQTAADAQPPPPGGSGILAVACAHPADAEADGVSLIAVPNTQSTAASMTLLVPDGVHSVTFTSASGSNTAAPVVNNVARAVGALTGATFATASGSTVTVSVPPAAATPQPADTEKRPG